MTYEELQLNKLLYRSDLQPEESSDPMAQSASAMGGMGEVSTESITDGELNGDISLVKEIVLKPKLDPVLGLALVRGWEEQE